MLPTSPITTNLRAMSHATHTLMQMSFARKRKEGRTFLPAQDMFAKPRPKKSPLPPAPSKKRKAAHTIEEISFDNTARADYLTGFHKRKVQRQKHAQEEAAKRARQERIELRKQVRVLRQHLWW